MMMIMMMMAMMMKCFCGKDDWWKAFVFISSRDHCQRFSPFHKTYSELEFRLYWFLSFDSFFSIYSYAIVSSNMKKLFHSLCRRYYFGNNTTKVLANLSDLTLSCIPGLKIIKLRQTMMQISFRVSKRM